MSSDLPETWTQQPLENLCERVSVGHVGETSSFFTESNGIPFIRSQNVRPNRVDLSDIKFITKDFHAKSKKSQLRGGDLLIVRVGQNRGDCAVLPGGLGEVNCANIVFARPDSRYSDFFGIYFNTPKGHDALLAVSSGSAQLVLNTKAIAKIEVPVPPPSEAEAIGALGRAFDDRITLLRETNATLEAIAQALFKSWFVDFDPVRAKMEGRTPEGMDEATAALFPDGFETSELGEVPRGWRSATMEDVSVVGIGKTPPRKEQHWFSEDSSDVRWVSIRDMGICGTYASTTSEFLTVEAVDKFNVRRVPDNTVLMSFKMTIGRVAITDGEMTTNEAIAHFRLDPDSPLSTEFIYLHLRHFDFSKLSSTSSIADAVNSKTVRKIPILVPGGEVATAFQEQIGVVFEMLKSNEQQAQTLSTLRDTLLPRLISGQLRIPNAEMEETTA